MMSAPLTPRELPEHFGEGAIRQGAVLLDPRGELIDADEAVAAIEEAWRERDAVESAAPRLVTDAIAVLPRGPAWIVPLSWEPSGQVDDQLRERASQLWRDVRGACEHRHGIQIGIDLSAGGEAGGSYAAELARTGARRADWWAFDESAIVLVIYGPPVPQPPTLIALQIVPRSWVWDDAERSKATSNAQATGDLSWSWAVVAGGSVD